MKQLLLKSVMLILLLGIISSTAIAQQQKYHRVQCIIPKDKFQDLMQSGLGIDHYSYQNEVLIAEVSDHDVKLIKSKHIKIKYLIKDLEHNLAAYNAKIDKDAANAPKTRAVTVPTPVHFGTGGTYGPASAVAKHFTYQDMQNALDQMRTLYPNLITIKTSIGNSIEGRPLYMVKISDNPDVDENEPEVFLNAVHHAREPISMTQLIFFMWHLLENYSTDKEIQTLVNSTEIYIVPCVNPDGYVYNQTTNSTGGGMWRKNRRNNGGGTYGVDNNRNYGYGWGGAGASSVTSDDTYRGTSAFSEPETQAVRDFCNSRQFVSELNYHSYGNYCIYPYSNVSVNNNPEISLFTQLSTFLTTDNAFVYGNAQATVNYLASGGAEDWAYAEQTTKGKMYGFTPEIGTASDGFYPAASRIIPLCNSMIVMNKNFLKFSTKYASVTTSAPSSITSLNGTVPFAIKNFSVNPATYTVTLTPISSYITNVDAAKIYSTLGLFQTQNDVFNFTLDPAIPIGTSVSFEVNTDNSYTVRKDTITLQYTCAAPNTATTSSITTTSANASWAGISGVTDYYLSYKLASSSTWGTDVLVSASTSSVISGLTANTSYNWRVRDINCTNYSATQTFTTLTICGMPSPASSSVTSSGFTISWASVASATSYDVQTRLQGSSTWTSSSVTTLSKVVTGLSASSVYEYQVRANCPSGAGTYSAIQTVTTLATTLNYCASNGTTNTYEWIDYIQLAGITRSSNKETGGYINTGLSTNLVRGNVYTITFSAGFASTVYAENWRVYIDYNHDGDFADAGETIVSTSKTGAGNYTASFTVPATATLASTRMRVQMSYSSVSSSCGTFSYGEVEDYTINITSVMNKTNLVGSIDPSNGLDITVMPNPFIEQINILLENNNEEHSRIMLMDLNGRIAFQYTLSKDETTYQINTADLPSGMYILQIQNGEKRKIVKMVK